MIKEVIGDGIDIRFNRFVIDRCRVVNINDEIGKLWHKDIFSFSSE